MIIGRGSQNSKSFLFFRVCLAGGVASAILFVLRLFFTFAWIWVFAPVLLAPMLFTLVFMWWIFFANY